MNRTTLYSHLSEDRLIKYRNLSEIRLIKYCFLLVILILAGCKHYHCPVPLVPNQCVYFIKVGVIMVPNYYDCSYCPVDEVEDKE